MIDMIIKEEWSPEEGIILDDNSLDIIKSDSNILITAGPGAGKTEVLAQKSNFIFETSKRDVRILAISFKKDAAVNLKERIVLRCGLKYDDYFDSFTYDAFAKQILDQYYKILSKIFQPSPDYVIEDGVSDIIKEFCIKTYSRYDRITLKNIRMKLDSTEIHKLMSPGLELWELLLNSTPTRLSFPMITILVLEMIKSSPIIKNIVSSSYDYVFLDEFQDTTSLQYELVKSIFKDTSVKLVAVGDEKQRIMTWAGADKNVFKKFIRDFNGYKKELMFNFRSAPKLIQFQLEVYNILNAEKVEISYNPKYNEEDGVISLNEFKNNELESNHVSSEIVKLIESGVNPKEICILTKQLPLDYTENLINQLNRINIYARVETHYQDLIKEPVVKLIIALLDLINGGTNPNSWIVLSDFFEKTHKTGFKIDNMILLDYRIMDIRDAKGKFVDVKELTNLIDEVLNLLGIEKLKTVFAEYTQGKYLVDVIKRFKDLYCFEFSRINVSNLSVINDSFLGENSIPIMTVHKSKGLEFTYVFFMGLEDSAFWSYRDNPMENKNTFFVALSRAKKEIHFTFSEKRLNFAPPLKRFNCINQFHRNISEIYELVKRYIIN